MLPSANRPPPRLYRRIHEIVVSTRAGVARTVNSAQVVSSWLIGQEIIVAEQKGARRAGYGERLLRGLADRLRRDFGAGYSYVNLKLMRQFHLAYPTLLGVDAPLAAARAYRLPAQKGYALRSLSRDAVAAGAPEPWTPGRLHPNLSWTHYRVLMRVERADARSFYEIDDPQRLGPPTSSRTRR